MMRVMNLIIVDNYEEMSCAAERYVIEFITKLPQSVIGLTTGNTPMGLYSRLSGQVRDNGDIFKQARIFLAEEYLGIDPNDRRSLYAWLYRSFLGPCRILDQNIVRMIAEDVDPGFACLAYEEELARAGGFSLLIEGIGVNGHIGFNEPGSLFSSRTRVVNLHEDTLAYNVSYWNESVPERGITIGLANVLESKHILLMASGANKSEALLKALEGPVTSEVPASCLQQAQNLTVIADRSAAALLKTAAGATWQIE
jgi:glucosamine-6-phosphate deaminase